MLATIRSLCSAAAVMTLLIVTPALADGEAPASPPPAAQAKPDDNPIPAPDTLPPADPVKPPQAPPPAYGPDYPDPSTF